MGKVVGKTYVILAGGYLDVKTISIPENAVVICADKGYLAAKELGLDNVLVLGDFDSLGFIPKSSDVQIYPSKKDDTDTLLAVKEALKLGASEIFIYGALGGRIDHTFANIQTLMFIAENGALGTLVSDENMVTFQTSNTCRRYKRRDGYYFSVFSYSEKSTGVNISGTEYTLSDAVLTNNYPLGVSNHITNDYAEVSVGDGCLIIMESKEI